MDAKDRSDLAEIKADVKGLLQQSIKHNVLLEQHEARSLALQRQQDVQAQRFVPLEKQYDLVRIILAALGTTTLAILGKLALAALHLI